MIVAPSQPSRGPRRASRVLASIALVLGGVLAFLVVMHNYRLHAAPERTPFIMGFDGLKVPGATDVKIEDLTRTYFHALKRGDYTAALGCAVAEFRAQQTPTKFQGMIQSRFAPTTQVDAIQGWHSRMYQNKRLVQADMTFRCPGPQLYQISMLYSLEGGHWRIQNVSPPFPFHAPPGAGGFTPHFPGPSLPGPGVPGKPF